MLFSFFLSFLPSFSPSTHARLHGRIHVSIALFRILSAQLPSARPNTASNKIQSKVKRREDWIGAIHSLFNSERSTCPMRPLRVTNPFSVQTFKLWCPCVYTDAAHIPNGTIHGNTGCDPPALTISPSPEIVCALFSSICVNQSCCTDNLYQRNIPISVCLPQLHAAVSLLWQHWHQYKAVSCSIHSSRTKVRNVADCIGSCFFLFALDCGEIWRKIEMPHQLWRWLNGEYWFCCFPRINVLPNKDYLPNHSLRYFANDRTLIEQVNQGVWIQCVVVILRTSPCKLPLIPVWSDSGINANAESYGLRDH